MLAKESSILVREEGKRTPVESLQISDFIFDPLADRYCEIVDILSREVDLKNQTTEVDAHPLRPVVFLKNSLGVGRPLEKVIVSPSQPILTTQKANEVGTPTVALQLASTLSKFDTPEHSKVTYFAIFTEGRQYLDVSGVLMQSYAQDVYNETARWDSSDV